MNQTPKSKKEHQGLVDCGNLSLWEFTKDAPYPPLVNRTQLIDKREGLFGKAAPSWREGRIKNSFAWGPGHWHDAHEWIPLVAYYFGITDHDARPHATLLVANCGVECH